MVTRYDASGIQSEFEPGSRDRVLRNLLGITRLRDIQQAESEALQLAQARAIETFFAGQTFTDNDICKLHRLWLGPVYAWAGEYRNVNLSKDGFMFTVAERVPHLMKEFSRSVLAVNTPCPTGSRLETAGALATVHAELILIHPFRDGNGRVARLVALLMALQAGLPPLDFSPLDGKNRKRYIAGIHAAMDRDYRILTELFVKVIDRTGQSVSSSGRSRPAR
jgi:cell filamentation protein